VTETFSDLRFPLGGIDRSRAFSLQPPRQTRFGPAQTTVLGVNVRAFAGGRARGGSRPGLVKYATGRVGD
jgi:hypothetical protein